MKNLLTISSTKIFFRIYGLLLVLFILGVLLSIYPLFVSAKDTMIPPIFLLLFLVPPVLCLYLLINFIWYWQVGNQLFKKLPEQLKLYLNIFKIMILVPVIIVCLLLAGSILALLQSSGVLAVLGTSTGMLGAIIPLFIFLPSWIYISFFNGKILKTLELGREARLGDYIGDMLLFFFPIIGVWFLQPRIKRQIVGDEM